MRLEVILKGKGIERVIRQINFSFSMEKDRNYFRLSFPLNKTEEVDCILKSLNNILGEDVQVINTSIESEKDVMELANGYRILMTSSNNLMLPEEKEIILKKGLSFGGFHPTTKMCLELLIKAAAKYSNLNKVLDLGTGSGILAIMAKKLGIKDVYAIDIDFQSCIECRDNAILNGYYDIKVICGSELSIKGIFDLIMVNIIFHTLKEIMKNVTDMLKPKGLVILSGFLAPDKGSFIRILGRGNVLDIKEEEGWGAILWQKE